MAKRTRNEGKIFEQQFKKSVNNTGFLFERFPDSNKFGQGGNEKTRFTMNSPCDCFIFDTCKLYYIELKHTKNIGISFNQPPTEKQGNMPMIKPHQVKSLLERSKYHNVVCGLVLDFADRETKKTTIEGGTYFVEINIFVDWCNAVAKKSINQEDCEMIGIKIKRTKKRTNYEYDIEQLLNDIK